MKENIVLHPWQTGPSELLQYALNGLQESNDCQRRISFLLIDCSVETLLKTYLLLPDGVVKQATSFYDRRKAAQSNFHELIEGIKKAAPTGLTSCNLSHIEFYHNIRNHLYHQGNGITVADSNLLGYAKLAATIMKELIGIDFTTHPALASASLAPENICGAKELQENLSASLKGLSRSVHLVMEITEPRLVLPSNLYVMQHLSNDLNVCNFASKIDEFIDLIENSVQNEITKQWIKGLIASSPYDSPQALSNAKYIMESLADPTFFYLAIIGTLYLPDGRIEKDYLYSEEDISFLGDEEYHIAGLYQTASVYKDQFNYLFNSEQDRSLVIIETCRELISKLDVLSSKLRAWVKENKNKPYDDKTD